MNGAGAFPAGIGLAGLSPVQPGKPRLARGPSSAAFFDPRTRQFPFDASGALVAANYVDVAVALAWFVERGAIKSAPDVGRALKGIVMAGPLQGAVDARMRAAVSYWVTQGKIQVLSIVANVPGSASPGRLEVLGNYKNIVTNKVMSWPPPQST